MKIEGLDETVAAFESESRTVNRRVSAVVRSTARQVADTAKSLAPVESGATRDSIRASAQTGGPLGPESLIADIGPDTYYARFVEYGTSKMAPHAFMGPALDRHAATFAADIERAAGEDL